MAEVRYLNVANVQRISHQELSSAKSALEGFFGPCRPRSCLHGADRLRQTPRLLVDRPQSSTIGNGLDIPWLIRCDDVGVGVGE